MHDSLDAARASATIANQALPAGVSMPCYPREILQSRIVHLGFGAFHRAHQALLTDRVLNACGGDWGICETSMFSGEALMAALRRQDHLYTVMEKSAQGNSLTVVGSVSGSLHARLDGMEAIIEKLAEPQVAIVSLTITEKGYCLDRSTGAPDLQHPLIAGDLATPAQPQSAPGVLVEALRRRRDRGLSPFTVLSCDNMPENGEKIQAAVLGIASLLSTDLAAWIADQVGFPNTMVDRIVPAATEQSLDEIAAALGVADPCAISCEPFIQWVVEDRFVAGRPAWEQAGVQFVNDVRPYEEMKLRMLNGSHSFLAWLGYLAGFAHISDCMQDSDFQAAAFRLMMSEQAPTLRVQEVNLDGYAAELLHRFANPALLHRTWQIAMDGTQKLPQRMLDSVRWHIARDSDYPCLTLGIAGWMRYVSGVDDAGAPIEIKDPLVDTLRNIVQNSADGEPRVKALLAVKSVFGEDLPANEQFVDRVTAAYLLIKQRGAKAAVGKLHRP